MSTVTVTSTTAGSVTVTAYLGASASATAITQTGSITFTAGAATQVGVVTPAGGAVSGSSFTTQPVVELLDGSGSRVTSDSSTVVTVSVSSGGTLTGTATATAASGLVTFSGLGLTGSAGTYTLTFSSGSLTSATQSVVLTVPTPPVPVKQEQTISFPLVAWVTFGAAPVMLGASASSGLPVTYSSTRSDAGVCTVSGSTVAFIGSGNCNIDAWQAGNDEYVAAGPVGITIRVSPAQQPAVKLMAPTSARFGEDVALAASGGATGAVYTFLSMTNPAYCKITGSTLSLGNAGTSCSVLAAAAAPGYAQRAAPTQVITVTKADQVVTFTTTPPASPKVGGFYLPVAAAKSAVTGLGVGAVPVLTVTGAACRYSNRLVVFTGPGTCTITATSKASSNFTEGTPATQTIVIGAVNQSITFAQPADVSVGSPSFQLNATASSGLPVLFARGPASTPGACAVSPLGVVTVLGVGTCSVVASQEGDPESEPASSVTRAFQIRAAVPAAPTVSSLSGSDRVITVAFTAPGFDGGAAVIGYVVTLVPADGGASMSVSCASTPCSISGPVNGVAYRVSVAAVNSAGTGPSSASAGPVVPTGGASAAVAALSVELGDRSATLRWVPLTLAQLGSASFTRYAVYYRVHGASDWIPWSDPALASLATTTITVTGLDNNRDYDFQLVAMTSAYGSSVLANTATVAQFAATVPSAPQALSAVQVSSGRVQVSWEVPASDGGAPLVRPGYVLELTSSVPGARTPIECVFADQADRFCTASGLTPGTVYSVSVAAQNRIGVGPARVGTFPEKTSGVIQRAAFFKETSRKFTVSGLARLRSMVAAVPKGARNVRVTVVGVSVSMPAVRSNLNLARDRAQEVADFLVAQGVRGHYSVSISTDFDIGANGSVVRPGTPKLTRSGKPLTTATISYDLAGAAPSTA